MWRSMKRSHDVSSVDGIKQSADVELLMRFTVTSPDTH